jgi:LPXTG-motif cell wall-anchored protein
MNMAQLLKDSANTVQAATLVKRTASDVVRQVPYAAMGAAVLVGALAGILLRRRRRSA